MNNNNQRGSQPNPKKGTPNPKKGGPKKQFNFYWIYGIIGVLLLGLQLFSMGGGEKKTTWDKFVNEMLKTNEVEKVVVVTSGNEHRAEIYIKPEALEQDKYKARHFLQSFGRAELGRPDDVLLQRPHNPLWQIVAQSPHQWRRRHRSLQPLVVRHLS